MLGNGLPHAERLEQVLGCRRQGEGARVGPLGDVGHAIDECDLELRAERIAQRTRQGEAGEAGAGDCDIEAGGLKRHVASGHLR